MNSVWYSLLWKEFREHLWKAVALTAMLVAAPVWTMFDMPSGTYFATTMALTMYTPLAAVYLAMGIAAGERSAGTIVFVGSLPVKLWKLAVAKLAAAFAAFVFPVVVMLLIVRLWESAWPLLGIGRLEMNGSDVGMFSALNGTDGWYLVVAATVALGGGSLLLWAAATGCNMADEVRAAAVALTVILGWWIATELAALNLLDSSDEERIAAIMLAVPPGSPAAYPTMLLEITKETTVPAAITRVVIAVAVLSLSVHVLLAATFALRFGRSLPAAPPLSEHRLAIAPAVRLPSPRRSQLSAIMWKQMRETGPLALIALVSVAGIAACIAAASYDDRSDFDRQLAQGLFIAVLMVGMFVVAATGVGSFDTDLRPKLHTFWRSRPITPSLWFWTKLLTGLVLVSVAVYLPVCYGLLTSDTWLYRDFFSVTLPFHLLGFTSATVAICLLRQPIYAAILSIGASASIYLLVEEKVSSDGWQAACIATLIVLNIAIAWAAVRWNIGVGRSRAR